MIVITGGAFQGKLEFAKTLTEYFKDADHPVIVEGERLAEEECPAGKSLRGEADILKQAEIIAHFHLYIRKLLEQGKDAAAETEKLLKLKPDLIIEVTELGCGIVPVDAFDRAWREAVGRISCTLAKKADAVYRVNCGIASRLDDGKGGKR